MKVVVCGGGVGGLAAALALERAGADVTVVERRDGPGPELGLHVWPNGVRALEQLGVASALVPGVPATRRAEFRARGGRLLATWDLESRREQLGAVTVGLTRTAIVGALRDALRTTALVSDRLTSYESGRGVTARLASGATVHGDVLVGADGADSLVAAQLRGASAGARSIVWQGVAVDPVQAPESGTLSEWWGRGQRFVCFETGPSRWAWAFLGGDPALAGWDPTVTALVAATPVRARLRGECRSERPSRVWGDGRVTLLGDAAHPMGTGGGQGVAQALEDALALAGRLAAGGDPEAALRAYEADRRPRASRQQRLARRLEALGRVDGVVSGALRDRFIGATWTRVGLPGVVRDAAAA